MSELEIHDLRISYGNADVVKGVSLSVKPGEFVTLLGPSGCGKTTTLSAIAGLTKPTSGTISLGGTTFFDHRTRTFLEPEKRGVGLVFQTYALWPHMTVRENLAYPLKLRRIDKVSRDKRIDETLHLVEMDDYIDRYPSELSGGQQQRVALARTLVYRPSLMLLDEPLSNLDAKLRERARSWLRRLQTSLGLTTIYVTHDQTEALAMSDRIAVMDKGRIVQLDGPAKIYGSPANPFVANFVGSTNFCEGKVVSTQGSSAQIILPMGSALTAHNSIDVRPGEPILVAIRPEAIRIVAENRTAANVLTLPVEEAVYLGTHYEIVLSLGDTQFRVKSDERPMSNSLSIELPVSACRLFPAGLEQGRPMLQ